MVDVCGSSAGCWGSSTFGVIAAWLVLFQLHALAKEKKC